MSTTEIAEFVTSRTPEERQFMRSLLDYLAEAKDPSQLADLDNTVERMKEGQSARLEEAIEQHEELLRQGR